MPTYYLTDGRCGRCDNRLLRPARRSAHADALTRQSFANAAELRAEAKAQGLARPSDGGPAFAARWRAAVLDAGRRAMATLPRGDGEITRAGEVTVFCKRCKITYTLT